MAAALFQDNFKHTSSRFKLIKFTIILSAHRLNGASFKYTFLSYFVVDFYFIRSPLNEFCELQLAKIASRLARLLLFFFVFCTANFAVLRI